MEELELWEEAECIAFHHEYILLYCMEMAKLKDRGNPAYGYLFEKALEHSKILQQKLTDLKEHREWFQEYSPTLRPLFAYAEEIEEKEL